MQATTREVYSIERFKHPMEFGAVCFLQLPVTVVTTT